ncbi:MAG: hypothetical protein HY904_04650 [Deltaproteobacteria bacterium]|nr:hypothetical protein [Deltaproteobacteria bacterium]
MTKCPHCDATTDPVAEPRCQGCRALLPLPAGASPFDVLGLPTSYALTAEALDAAFRRRSMAVHPDRLARASDKERRIAVERTAALTEAHRTLRDVEARALALLRLAGVTPDHRADPTLLADLMETRERAEQGDDVRRALVEQVGSARAGLLTDLERRFGELEREQALRDAARVAPLGALVTRVRYLTRLWEDLQGQREHAVHVQ